MRLRKNGLAYYSGKDFIIMATFSGTIFSKALDMCTGLTVVTPADITFDETPYKVVYLLHGLSDNHSCWKDNSRVSLYATEYNVVFIMPEVQRSYYFDMAYGLNYFTYISEELPKICKKLFNISSKREDTYVMGLSMGGYGAMKCALTYPEKYAACGAFSAACKVEHTIRNQSLAHNDSFLKQFKGVIGTELLPPDEGNLYKLAEKAMKKDCQTEIFLTCGTEDDSHYQDNVDLAEYLESIGYPCRSQWWKGVHDWYFWDDSLKLMMETFFSKSAE